MRHNSFKFDFKILCACCVVVILKGIKIFDTVNFHEPYPAWGGGGFL